MQICTYWLGLQSLHNPIFIKIFDKFSTLTFSNKTAGEKVTDPNPCLKCIKYEKIRYLFKLLSVLSTILFDLQLKVVLSLLVIDYLWL